MKLSNIFKTRIRAGAIVAGQYAQLGAANHYTPFKIPVRARRCRVKRILIQSPELTAFRVHFYNHSEDLFTDTPIEGDNYFGYVDMPNAILGPEMQNVGPASRFYHYQDVAEGAGIEIFVPDNVNTMDAGVLIENSGGVDSSETYLTIFFEKEAAS